MDGLVGELSSPFNNKVENLFAHIKVSTSSNNIICLCGLVRFNKSEEISHC